MAILGTGRSGTSAITRAFVAAGFFVGGEGEVLGPSPSNPHGHYEPLSVLALNEELLAEFGCGWWADVPDPAEQVRERERIEPRLIAVLEATIASGEGRPIAIKEPRINPLLPLWGPAIERFLHPVLAVRDPLEVAMSLFNRDGTPLEQGLAAWEAHLTMVLGWLDGRTVTVAPYADLTAQPELAAEMVTSAAAHLAPRRRRRVKPEAATSALDPSLRHEVATELGDDEHLTDRQAELWGFLRTLPVGEVELRVPLALPAS